MKYHRDKYNHTGKGKAARARYARSAKGKARIRRSDQRNGWRRHLREFYGITVEDYAWLLYAQDFKCPICGDAISKDIHPAGEQQRRPCLDHDHVSGTARGVVCGWCNYKLLGPMEVKGPEVITRAMAYLGWNVTSKKSLGSLA